MLGFTTLGYFPSSPSRPEFAISEDILSLFNDIYMRGSASKLVFCEAIKLFVKRKGPLNVRLCYHC